MGEAVWLSTIGPSERLSARLDDLGQFLVLRYLAPLWAERTGAFLQRVSQLQKGRMPCGQSVIAQFGIDAVVAVAVNKTACDSCDPGIGVNVAQGIQCPLAVVGRKGAAVIALFPKMPGPL